jgi:GNAT superfamily N-acetyltransferase
MLPPSVPKREGLAMTAIVVTALRPSDQPRWAELWRGYLDFYQTSLPPETYEHTWRRLIAAESPIRGLGARLGGEHAPLVGIVHYLFHAHAWSAKEVCYLQDLFVGAAARRHGVGRELIAAVAGVARERGCLRLYWTTKEDNATARSLYDRIARFNGFIRYDYPLDPAPLRHGPPRSLS